MTVIDPTLAGSRSAAISSLAIRLLSRYAGRGPNKARTYFNDDMVTIVLSDILTKPEATLLRHGNAELVTETRKAFQDVMADELIAGIEEITGRKVIAFLSANHIDPAMAVETFILASEHDASQDGRAGGTEENGASRAD